MQYLLLKVEPHCPINHCAEVVLCNIMFRNIKKNIYYGSTGISDYCWKSNKIEIGDSQSY